MPDLATGVSKFTGTGRSISQSLRMHTYTLLSMWIFPEAFSKSGAVLYYNKSIKFTVSSKYNATSIIRNN
jgi:hypothetical protein